MTHPLPVVCIFGPTAVGKTELLLSLLPGKIEVISADSMQVYQGLDIGTAKPSLAVQERIPHHLIDIIKPSSQYTVGEFVPNADVLVKQITDRGKIAVISGGTAFYIKTFLYGLPRTPPANQSLREQLNEEYRLHGSEVLYRELCEKDPESGDRIAASDVYRVLRALEVIRDTGKPFSAFLPREKPREKHSCLLIGLNLERKALYQRINSRVEEMFDLGLIQEIKNLIAAGCSPEDPGLRGIGYKEFFEMGMEGCLSMRGVKERIQQNSRRYAKRQLTFFRSMEGIAWFNPLEAGAIELLIQDFLFS